MVVVVAVFCRFYTRYSSYHVRHVRSILPVLITCNGPHTWCAALREQCRQGLHSSSPFFSTGVGSPPQLLARANPLLRDQSPHFQPHLRPPANPRHLSRAPALRDATDRHCRLSLLPFHVPNSPARAARHADIPGGPTVDAAAGSARRPGVLGETRRAAPATPTTEDEGYGSAALAKDRGGPETRDAGEYRPPAYDWELCWQETRDGSACTRTEHTDECQDSEEAQ